MTAARTAASPFPDFSAAERDALVLAALLGAPLEPDLWAEGLAASGLAKAGSSVEKLDALADRCVELGLADVVWRGKLRRFWITAAAAEQLFLRAPAAELDKLAAKVMTLRDPGKRKVAAKLHTWLFGGEARLGLAIGGLRLALTRADERRIAEQLRELTFHSFGRDEFAAHLLIALGTTPSQAWFAALPEGLAHLFLTELIPDCTIHLLRPPAQLVAWVTGFNDPALTLDCARLLALRGDHAGVLALGKLRKWGAEATAMLERFAAGEHRAAAELGDQAVAAMRTKHPQFKGLEGAVHALLRAATIDASPERAAALRQTLAHARTAKLDFSRVYVELDAFEQARRAGDKRRPATLGEPLSPWWLALLVRLSCLHWLGFSIAELGPDVRSVLEQCHARAVANGYAGVAREIASLVALYDGGEPAPDSVAGCYVQRAGWETLLETIESTARLAQVAATPAREGPEFQQHIVWELDVERGVVDLRPLLIASARARKGKPVSLASLLDGKLDCLTPADQRVLATARRGSRKRGRYGQSEPPSLGDSALLALVDHPRVRRPDGQPLRVTRGQPTLKLREAGGKLRLELHPPGLARAEIDHVRVAADQLEVYARDAKLASLFELFGRRVELPAAARARLLDSLAALATTGELRVEGDARLSGRAVTADPRPVMQLRWDGDRLVVQARVAPLGLDGPQLHPGEGPDEVVARVGAELQTTTRDRGDERARFEALLDACPTLAGAPEDRGRWDIDRIELALELLLELQACGDAVVLTWPKHRKLGVTRRLGSSALRVDVSSARDWLELGVTLELDEGQVLDFKQLLRSRAGDGRFIALGDDQFIALTDDLRRRLDALENLGAVKQAKLAAPLVSLALLDDLVGEQAGLKLDAAARTRLERLRSIAGKTPRAPRGLAADLRDYQLDGYRWIARLAEASLGAVLADDMGLGKTIQALALLCQRSKQGPALVVAPTSVVRNWQAEAERFAPSLRVASLSGAGDRQALIRGLGRADVLLCSYGLLVSEAEALAAVEFATVVFDEAHALKNAGSRRAKAAFALRSEFRLALTGTPLENHLGELWSVFQATVPGLLNTQKRFDERFARPIAQGQRERARQLRALIRPFLLRRTKAQVLDELPPRTEVTIRVSPGADERAFYEALRRDAIERTRGDNQTKGGNARLRLLAEITRLRQAAVDPRLVDPSGPSGAKITALIRRLVDLRAEGHRALVFTQFLGSLATIQARLDAEGIAWLGFDGSTPAKQRAEAVAAFQAGDGDVFVMSLKAGGVGINLTGADYVIHLDPWWNPAVEDQATGRAHRIGQQRPVTVYRLVTEGTIEEQILDLHASKRDLADDLLADLERAKQLDLDQLRALLRGTAEA